MWGSSLWKTQKSKMTISLPGLLVVLGGFGVAFATAAAGAAPCAAMHGDGRRWCAAAAAGAHRPCRRRR